MLHRFGHSDVLHSRLDASDAVSGIHPPRRKPSGNSVSEGATKGWRYCSRACHGMSACENEVVIVTGGSSGVGLVVAALAFAANCSVGADHRPSHRTVGSRSSSVFGVRYGFDSGAKGDTTWEIVET
jgi:hypothetical protein